MTPSLRPQGLHASADARPRSARKVVSRATLVARLVALARSEVGTHEVGGNNRGVRVEEYQQATWLNPGPWPWCAAFTCWLLREWARDPAVRGRFKLAADADVGRWRCRDARAFGWEPWARSRGLKVLGAGSLARAGDIVVFEFPHIGLVVAKQVRATDPLHTIEGNTNGAGERDSDTGDGVWEKRRDPLLARSLIRLLEPPARLPTPPRPSALAPTRESGGRTRRAPPSSLRPSR